jgi:uncharacterized protein DUF935
MAQRRAGNLAVIESVDDWSTPPPLGQELGSAFGWNDRLFYGWTEDGAVFDYGDWAARDLVKMMERDYKARQIEQVLALPLMSAEREIDGVKGDKGELDWLNGYWDADPIDGGCKTALDQIIGSCTTAFTYRKAFMEKVFREGYEGKIVYDKVAFRPATTCRMKRDPKNGTFMGFEQEAYAPGPNITEGFYPVQISPQRAFVYVHGTRTDPLNGTSDLEIAHWCYKTKQKLLFLWMQFLESVALPRTVVKANDVEIAKQIASQIARMRGSAVVPVGTGGSAQSVDVTTLDSSGKGAEQFTAAITWLDTAATHSVLAGFLDLTGAAANGLRGGGGGSYALSKDASDYFLQFEEAKCREIERSIRRDLFAPLIRYNFGRSGKVPKLKFEPLNTEDKSQQIAMLTALMSAKGPEAVPNEFVAMLAQQTASYFGMDATKVHDAFVAAGKAAAAAAAAASPAGASPLGQGTATIAGATDAASAIAAPTVPDTSKKPLPPELAHLDWSQLGTAA